MPKHRATRRQAIKGTGALGLGLPLLHSAAMPAQSPVTITWFAARDSTEYTPKQADADAQSTTIKINYS